jgi:pimeloyl-ACP methyl ester carboxylesterase
MPQATRNGVRVHYDVVGHGYPLVMVAGATLHGSFWTRAGYVDALADQFRCVLVDPRGMGGSSRPAEPSDYSIRETTADVLAIAHQLELGRFAFWGGSLGGSVGLVLAAEHPRRVTALVLSGAGPSLDYPAVGRALSALARRAREVGDPAVVVREMCDAERIPADHWIRTFDHGDADVVAALLEGWLDYDWEARAAPQELQTPTLMLIGEHEVPRAEARAVADAMPNARVVTLPGVGHVGGQLALDESRSHAVPFLRRWAACRDS